MPAQGAECGVILALARSLGLTRTPEGLPRVLQFNIVALAGRIDGQGNFLEAAYDSSSKSRQDHFCPSQDVSGGGEWYTLDWTTTHRQDSGHVNYTRLHLGWRWRAGKPDTAVQRVSRCCATHSALEQIHMLSSPRSRSTSIVSTLNLPSSLRRDRRLQNHLPGLALCRAEIVALCDTDPADARNAPASKLELRSPQLSSENIVKRDDVMQSSLPRPLPPINPSRWRPSRRQACAL